MHVIHIGSSSEFVKIVLPKSNPIHEWVDAEAEISVHCFRGTVRIGLLRMDLEVFLTQLRTLYNSLHGCANFSHLDGQFELELQATATGQIKLTGTAWSQATYENKLEFELQLDQTFLEEPIKQLENLLALWPCP